MELIAFKIFVGSSFFAAVYFGLLQKERMFAFNRFYLLFTLVFSYAVPFFVLRTAAPKPQDLQISFEEAVQKIPVNQAAAHFDWMKLFLLIYVSVSLFFLIKAVLSVMKIRNLKGEKIIYQNMDVLLTDKKVPPFSFWNTIYVNKALFEENRIEEAVFIHEKAHLEQKHSLDLLFLEVIKIFSWWNPALFFYRKAMIANHEFLADREVLKTGFRVKEYQSVILKELFSVRQFPLAHSFNFNQTKKRFIMMSLKNSGFSRIRKAGSIALLVPAFFLLVQKSYATEKTAEAIFPNENTAASEHILTVQNAYVASDTIKKKAKETEALPSTKAISRTDKNAPETPPPPPQPIPLDKNFIQAEFPEGMNAFRNLISQNFNSSVFSGSEGTLKSSVYLSVNEKGEVTKISVEGDNQTFNKETERVFSETTKNVQFTPATLDGKSVETVLRMPLTMAFQK